MSEIKIERRKSDQEEIILVFDQALAKAMRFVFDKCGGSVIIHKDYDGRIRIIEEIKPIPKILYKK